MENNLSVLDTNTEVSTGFGDVAEAPKSALSELRLLHNSIMGSKTVDGEDMEVAVVKAGSFSARMPDGEMYYSPSATVRLFVLKYCYERWDADGYRADGSKGNMVRTVFAPTSKGDLKDNDGTYNCGRPSYIDQDKYASLSDSKKKFYNSCKIKTVLFGVCSFDKPVDSEGNSVTLDEFPFKMHVGGKESRKNVTDMAKKLPKDAMIYSVDFKAVVKKGTGMSYAVFQPVVNGKVKDMKDTDDDEVTINFIECIKDKNKYTMNAWAEKNALKMSKEDSDIVGSIVDIEDEQ